MRCPASRCNCPEPVHLQRADAAAQRLVPERSLAGPARIAAGAVGAHCLGQLQGIAVLLENAVDLGRGVLPVHRERIEALRRQPGDKLGHEIELPPHVADDRRALRQYAGDRVRGEVALHQRGR